MPTGAEPSPESVIAQATQLRPDHVASTCSPRNQEAAP